MCVDFNRLVTLADGPKSNWAFEEKYDGVRILAYKEGSTVSLISRNGIDRTVRYPAVVSAVRELNADALLLDVFDSQNETTAHCAEKIATTLFSAISETESLFSDQR